MESWSANRIIHPFARLALLFIMTAGLWATPVRAGPGSAPAAGATVSQDRFVVVDWGSLFDDGQERSAIYDAYRLNAYGIPTQVVTEAVVLDQAQADARADELRISHGIESAPGADDGLLVYASVDRWDQRRIVMSISTGSRTLPRNGLTAATMDGIRSDIMAHQLAKGQPARAIVYSLREMIYLEQYVPPPAAPATGWPADVRPLFDILAPVLAVAGCAWLLVDGKRRAPTMASSWSSLTVWGFIAITLIALAITTRSSIGAFSAILLGGTVLWRCIQLDRQSTEGSARKIVATPRPPGAYTVVRR